MLATALYLKQCVVCLQQYYSKHTVEGEPYSMKVKVSLTGYGIPRIIPTYHRRMIREGGPKGDQVVKMYLSWFSLSKLILLAPKVSKSTFKSMVTPPNNIHSIRDICFELKQNFKIMCQRYTPWISSIPVHQGITWEPTWKSLPNSDKSLDLLDKKKDYPILKSVGSYVKKGASCFTCLKYELGAYSILELLSNSLEGMISPSALWVQSIKYAIDPQNTNRLHSDLSLYNNRSLSEATLGIFKRIPV